MAGKPKLNCLFEFTPFVTLGAKGLNPEGKLRDFCY